MSIPFLKKNKKKLEGFCPPLVFFGPFVIIAVDLHALLQNLLLLLLCVEDAVCHPSGHALNRVSILIKEEPARGLHAVRNPCGNQYLAPFISHNHNAHVGDVSASVKVGLVDGCNHRAKLTNSLENVADALFALNACVIGHAHEVVQIVAQVILDQHCFVLHFVLLPSG